MLYADDEASPSSHASCRSRLSVNPSAAVLIAWCPLPRDRPFALIGVLDSPWRHADDHFPIAGCPTSKDTCPNSGVPAGYDGTGGPNPYGPQGYSGPDPIHNYMDYSTDACYTGFTPGQGARMLNIWQIYRQGF
jgi:hypothetical protein